MLKSSNNLPMEFPTKVIQWIDNLLGVQQQSDTKLPQIPWKQLLLEWGIIIIAVTIYCSGFLDLKTNNALPGNESEIFQSLDQILETSLKQTGSFPLWNPYFGSGIPYAADPMLHVFNPLLSVPVILFGTFDGFKLGLYLSFLAAAFGMWWLGRRLGLSGSTRVWMALMYAFAGPPAARFIQGQYLFTASYAILPWGLAAIIAALKTPRRVYIALAAICFGWMFFTGNIYYPYYTLYALIFLGLIYLFQLDHGRLRLNKRVLIVFGLVGFLSLGLISLQLLPMAEFHTRLSKTFLEIQNSQTFHQVWLDLTTSSIARPDIGQQLTPEEYYAYVGLWPFMVLYALPLAWKKSQRRLIVFFSAVLLFVFFWVDFAEMPWRDFVLHTPFLAQFRYPTRMLALAVLAVIPLAGLSIEALLTIIHKLHQDATPKSVKYFLTRILMFGVLLFMLFSTGDLFLANRIYLNTRPYNAAPYEVTSWLRQYDNGTYYVSAPNGWHNAMLTNHLRYFDAWYHFQDIRRYDGMINLRLVQAGANYKIMDKSAPAPENSKIVKQFTYDAIYDLTDSLPFAFTIPTTALVDKSKNTPVQRDEVTPIGQVISGFNQIDITSQGEGSSTLVVLGTNYPGWKLNVDGRSAQLKNVGGYLAATMLPGIHRYVFSFQPQSFYLGLIISLISFLILLGFLTGGKIFLLSTYKALLEKIKSIPWPSIPQIIIWVPEPGKDTQMQNLPESGQQLSGVEPGVVQRSKVGTEAGLQADQSFTVTSPAGEEIQVQVTLNMPPGTRVRLTVEALEANGETSGEPVIVESDSSASLPAKVQAESVSVISQPKKATRRIVAVPSVRIPRFKIIWPSIPILSNGWNQIKDYVANHKLKLGGVLFALAIGIYLFTRLFALEYFPIYFFGDEAVQTLYAERLINNDFVDANGLGIPIYVEAAPNRWTPLIPMYFHAISVSLFGKSILETRATSAIMSLLAVISISLILKYIFNKRYWWAGILVASAIPAWFLQSRTAFETVMSTSFYAAFLLFYLLYRYKDPRYLYGALVFAALTFYSYSNAQVVMATAGLLLLLSDIRYHWKNWRVMLNGLLLAVIFALPILNFVLKQPGAIGKHLETVNSYWYMNIPLTQKIGTFISQYFYGLSPQYWVFPNSIDLSRHRMDNMGQIAFWTLPFIILGAILAIRYIKEPKYRAIIMVMLATPAGGALLQISITRVLTFIVPASILAILGFEWLVEQIQKRWGNFSEKALQIAVFVTLAILSLWMLRTALVDGPLWEKDYGLYGMQWGAKQLFVDTIPTYLERDPEVQILVTSTWANGPDNFLAFFVKPTDRQRVIMSGIQTYLTNYTPLSGDKIFVLTPGEYQDAVNSKKFTPIKIEQVLNYPDGSPGFYFVRLAYVDGVEKLFAEEKEARLTPVTVQIMLDGQAVTVLHSQTDAGQLSDAMDGNLATLMRGKEANPFFLQFDFSQPRTISGLALDFSAFDYKITYDLYAPGSETPTHYEVEQHDVHIDSHVEIKFDEGPAEVQKIVINITNLLLPTNQANIHIREIKFLP